MFPNAPGAHFCDKCGAPMSSYAATGPFESLFAEGHVYRQATERPRSLLVVLGIWIIFGMVAVAGGAMLFFGREHGLEYVILGLFLLPVSLVIIWKTTRSYFARPRVEENRDAS
jgi:MFS-type transporter involved in bile tolerance (Atg22 family)